VTGQIESLLERGVEAARAKEKERARSLLLHVIEQDQRNEKAWLWLSSVVETSTDKEVCLENVLIINPDNTYAAMGLHQLRRQPKDAFAPSSVLPRLIRPQTSAEREWGAPDTKTTPPPAERVCPRCDFRNPGWAYLCDHCGADLRRVNLRETVSEASERGRSFVTLLEVWGGAFVFNRLWAFRPEIELASWGRTLAALGLTALFAAAWRSLMALALWFLVRGGAWSTQVAINALRSAAQALLPTLLLMLVCAPIALLTWATARLMSGRQRLETHAHLTAVAFSAWVVLTALLAPLTVLVPSDAVTTIVTIAISAAGPIWLIQAVRTAQNFTFARAILTALLVAVFGAVLFLALELVTGGRFADFLAQLATAPFLPLPDVGG
jgi:hypothetical protein